MKLFEKKKAEADKTPAENTPAEKKKPFAALRTRRFDVGSYSVAAACIVIAIAVALNVLADALPSEYTKLDNSGSGLFTISQQTEDVLAGLDDEIEIYWIVQSGQEDSTLSLLLERYESMSENVHVTKKDPDVYPTFARQYTSGTVYNNDLVVSCGDRYRYVSNSEIYEYDYSNYYTSGSYDVSFAGEGALTSAISYVTNDSLPVMYTLTGHGESSLSSDYQSAVEKDNVEIEELSLLTVDAVPEDADLLFIYAPQSDLSEDECEMISEYLKSGGNLLLVTDLPVDGELTNLNALMEENYGVSVTDGIVVEGSQNNYAYGTPYYLLPDINSHDITSPLIDGGYYILLPIAQGLEISDTLPDGVSAESLLDTTSSAYSKVSGYSLTTYDKEDGDIDGPFSLAVAITDEIDDDTQSHIVWVSSAGLLDDTSNAQVSGANQDMFLNAIGWMCEQEESISVRAKSLSTEYLTISSSAASFWSLLLVGVLPVCALGIGIAVKLRRKNR